MARKKTKATGAQPRKSLGLKATVYDLINKAAYKRKTKMATLVEQWAKTLA